MYDVYKKEKKKGHRERKKKKKNGTLWPTNVNSHDVKVLFYGYRVHRVKKKEDRRYVENWEPARKCLAPRRVKKESDATRPFTDVWQTLLKQHAFKLKRKKKKIYQN